MRQALVLSLFVVAAVSATRSLQWLRAPLAKDVDTIPRNKTVFVTGAAGFIGFNLAASLHAAGNTVVGIDNFTPYYDVRLKEARAYKLSKQGVVMVNGDICDAELLKHLFEKYKFDYVAHLAAQAGVRYSVVHPHEYVHTNVDCFVTILELLRHYPQTTLTYASSSSVYGKDATIPFTEKDCSDHPTNVYGASKRMNEMLAHAYHHLYNISSTGLRFFTVYGPWGRPDMAPYIFTNRISKGETIDVYHTSTGKDMKRDFTYVDDIVHGIMLAMKNAAPFDVFNLGRGHPTSVPQFVEMIEDALGVKATKNDMAAHSAELPETFADTTHAQQELDYHPTVTTEEGVKKFTEWFQWYKKASETKVFPSRETYLPQRDLQF
eukprot:TRINITY_DN20865_c0_g1_i1.p1 TRINITY_DN20865_c0_g1~~TRINITY_DN20865_c0_g1_i1.p1  ORF type:complete len:378 (+),score=64.46 TRINITY_DN20865_c0_g1_i1:75-1208(+)